MNRCDEFTSNVTQWLSFLLASIDIVMARMYVLERPFRDQFHQEIVLETFNSRVKTVEIRHRASGSRIDKSSKVLKCERNLYTIYAKLLHVDITGIVKIQYAQIVEIFKRLFHE